MNSSIASPFDYEFYELDGYKFHAWLNQDFVSCTTLENCISYIKNEISLQGIAVVNIDYSNIKQHEHYFSKIFSVDGISYLQPALKKIILPNKHLNKIIEYFSRYNLSEYRDLIFYLMSHTQLRAAEANNYRSVKHIANAEQKGLAALVDIIEQHIANPNSAFNSIRFTSVFPEKSKTIKDDIIVSILLDSFIENMNLGIASEIANDDSWKYKLTSFFATKRVFDSLNLFNRTMSKALSNFLIAEGVVTLKDDPYPARLITPIVDYWECVDIRLSGVVFDDDNVRNWLIRY